MSFSTARRRFDVSLEDLQTFIAVADLKGIGRAARHLSLSQPSVSNRVRRLEEKLKVRLLEREERGVTLTDQGRQLHAQALETLGGLNDLFQSFYVETADAKRDVALSVTVMMAQGKLASILNDFRLAFPSVSVRVHEHGVDESIQALVDGRCDLALMSCEQLPDDLDHELMVVDETALFTAHAHPLNRTGGVPLREALAYPILLPSAVQVQLAPVYRAVQARGLALALAPEAEGIRHPLTLMFMAAAGLGVLLFPKTLIPDELRPALAAIDISDCSIPRCFGLVWAKGRRISPQARAFRDFLSAACAPDRTSWPDARRARFQVKPLDQPAAAMGA